MGTKPRAGVARLRLASVCLVLLAGAAAADPAPAPEPDPDPDGRAWLGVWTGDAIDGGAEILAVANGGPAALGGLLGGDIVVEFAGDAVASEADLGRALRKTPPGAAVSLRVLREGRRVELAVTPGQRGTRPRLVAPVLAPTPWPSATAHASRVIEDAGLTVTEIGPALRAHFGAPADAGVLVTRVETGKAAAGAGLEVGDVLVRIADEPVRSEPEVRGNLVRWNVSHPVRVVVIREGQPAVLTLKAERRPESADVRAQQIREQRLRTEIELLERRVLELRRELERLQSDD